MKKTLAVLGVPFIALSLTACMANPTTIPPGKYESETTNVDRYGVKTQKSTETEVYYDENGDKKATVESETTHDPQGLFNKSKSTTKKTYE